MNQRSRPYRSRPGSARLGSARPGVRIRRPLALLLAAIASPAAAQLAEPAQGDAPSADRPQPTIITPERTPRATPVSPGAPTPADALPGLANQDVSVAPARLVREGAFLIKRSGAVLRAPTGEWIIAWARSVEPDAADLPPMALLPSRALARLQRELGEDAGRALVEVTGSVTQFRGRNYVLPTLITVPRRTRSDTTDAGNDPTPAAAPDGAPGARPATDPAPPARPEDDPRVLDLIRQLERDRPIPTPSNREAEPEAPGLESPDLLIDGRAIVQQRGRFTRLATGNLIFQPDNDALDAAGSEPLLLLPSRMLEQAEALFQQSADGAAVRVSGRTFAYGSSRYLLLESVHRERRSELRPRQ